MISDRGLAPVMIGRRQHLQALEERLQDARAGSGQLTFVRGEAGVGKTRLLREFTDRLRRSASVYVLEGRCYQEDPPAPYAPFAEALNSFIRAHGPESVIRAAGPWARDLAKLAPVLEAVGQIPALGLDPHTEKRRLFEAIHHFIRPTSSEQCRVVVLEDLHWAGQTTTEMLSATGDRKRDRPATRPTYQGERRSRRSGRRAYRTALGRTAHRRDTGRSNPAAAGAATRRAVERTRAGGIAAHSGRPVEPGSCREADYRDRHGQGARQSHLRQARRP